MDESMWLYLAMVWSSSSALEGAAVSFLLPKGLENVRPAFQSAAIESIGIGNPLIGIPILLIDSIVSLSRRVTTWDCVLEKADALQAIDKQLPKCIKNREMSPKSNLIGNPAEPLRNEYSPAIAGAQVASLITFRGGEFPIQDKVFGS